FHAVHEFLWYGNPLGERTFRKDVRRLPPGSIAHIDATGMRLSRFWIPPAASAVCLPNETTISRTRDLLQRAVERQLVSDVPVGVFLSGGIDSSAIAAYASRASATTLQTFAVGFDDSGAL